MWMYKKDIKSIIETYLYIDDFGIEYFSSTKIEIVYFYVFMLKLDDFKKISLII